jgi:hypothetical protein
MLTLLEIVELARLLRGLLGSNPAAMLQALGLPTSTLPPFGSTDDPGYVKFVQACGLEQQLSLYELLGQDDRADRLRARSQPRPAVNPAAPRRVLQGGHPVVDRVRLWPMLPELLAGSRRILFVRGPEKSGKSYTRTILMDLVGCPAVPTPLRVVSVDVDGAGSIEALVRAVLQRLDAAPPPVPERGNSTDNWWINELVFLVGSRATVDPRAQTWIVFDGYTRAAADPNFDQFFSFLCLAAAESGHPNGPRVVLIDHRDNLPIGVQHCLAKEEIAPVDALDIKQFLKDRFPAEDDAAHGQDADRIWQEALQAEQDAQRQIPRLISIQSALRQRLS